MKVVSDLDLINALDHPRQKIERYEKQVRLLFFPRPGDSHVTGVFAVESKWFNNGDFYREYVMLIDQVFYVLVRLLIPLCRQMLMRLPVEMNGVECYSRHPGFLVNIDEKTYQEMAMGIADAGKPLSHPRSLIRPCSL